MPEAVPHRVGSLFYHRDSRLIETGHPVIVKSVDVTDLSPLTVWHEIRFDYGFGGDGRLYVEVQVCRPSPQLHWLRLCFRVGALIAAEARSLPEDLLRLGREIEVEPVLLRTELVHHAPAP